jgi:hypothetical protein
MSEDQGTRKTTQVAETRRVIMVNAEWEVQTSELNGFWGARVRLMETVAYGATVDLALSRLKCLWANTLAMHRYRGDLTDWLTFMGIQWRYATPEEEAGTVSACSECGEVA